MDVKSEERDGHAGISFGEFSIGAAIHQNENISMRSEFERSNE